MLKIIPIGGCGEIGLNMMVVEYDNTMFIIDAGLMFPEDHMLGIDIVIPEMEYIKENKANIKGIVITHAHEDHIGALSYLLREISIPVYGSAFTLGIVRNKLREFDLLSTTKLSIVAPGDKISIAPFKIEFIRVSHSTLGCMGLAITTPVGMIIHTGDFRINNCSDDTNSTDVSKFARFGDDGVLALLSDSTNVESEGYTVSDQKIAESLGEIVAKSDGRVIIALFASNIFRIQQIVKIALKNRRKIVLNGRSIIQTVAVAKELGYFSCPDEMMLDVKKVNSLPDGEILIITTGSQGEPMSALARMATGFHKQVNIKKGDSVILSSKVIPGNEKAISAIINNLYRRGADVVYDKLARVHVSGHACQEELKLMVNLTKPEYFIPVHGEYRHLVIHARLAEHLGIPRDKVMVVENGNIIRFDDNGGRIDGKIETGRILIDGKGIGDVGVSVLRQRRDLSEDGLVVVTMVLDEDTGIVLYGPELISRGFVFGSETGYLVDDAQCVILEIVEEIEPGVDSRINLIRSKLQKALKQYFFFTIGRRPVILPVIIEV